MRKFLVTALACVTVAGSAVAGVGSAYAATAGCGGTVQFTALAFDPPAVSPGHSSTVTLTVQNCTDQPQKAQVSLIPRYVMPVGGGYSFCGANDPYPVQAPLAPSGSYTATVNWYIYSGCRATRLHLTATYFGQSGTVTRDADLAIIGT